MRKILEIVKTDWKNIIKTPVAAFLIVSLMVLPSLYAWFNLKASWDPYSNTGDIAIAVINDDKGTEIRERNINVGEQIIDNLKENDALGWTFVSKKDADQGVKHGDYYASIYIPTDFSEKIGTLLGEEQIRPVIEYSVNEKINAIAPKMTSTGASTIVTQTSESFVEQVSKAVLTEFNKIGIELEKELPTIRNVENNIFALEEQLPDIEALGNKAITLEEKLPEITKQADKVIELQQVMPEIIAAANNVVRLNEKMPQIDKVGEGIISLQTKIPEIKQVADTIIDVDKDFTKIEELVANTLQDIQKAQDIVGKSQDALPEIKKNAENSEAFVKAISDYFENNKESIDTVNPVLKQNILLYQQTANIVHQFAVQLDHDKLTTTEIEKAIPELLSDLNSSISSIDQSIQLLDVIDQQVSNKDLEQILTNLQALQVSFESEEEMLTKLGNNISNITDNQMNHLIAVSDQAVNQANTLASDYDHTISPVIDKGIDHLQETAENASDNLQQAQEALPKVESILKHTEESLVYGEDKITKLQQRLPEIGDEIHQTALTIVEKLDDVESGVNLAVSFYKNQFPKVKDQIQRAASFVEKDLPKAVEEVDKVTDFIDNRLPQLENSVHKIADIVQNDLPGLEDTVRHTADRIRQFEGNHDLNDIIQLLKNDIEQESDFLANPIELNENKVFPIPNYGSANSPFYTTLSLWVGALLLISLLTVDVHNKEGIYKLHHVYFGRGLTFASIGLMQALIVTLGDLFLLDAYVKEPVWFVIFAIFISMVFMSIVYTFVSVFGNVGKGLAIILLVLQLSGSGGTFPIQVTPAFFQAINPFLPFTYAISLLREAVGGMVTGIVIRDIIVLFTFMIIAILFAILLKKPLDPQIRKVSEQAKKSGLIH
ncbi:YhgE/Pip family protein [Paraliobacillus sp. JSM ZJ581]|uniref:YhgE/Pip family protein n=1 Tax=Paraliobacillus sp. JSM ZJ581 TaxID=3342118 RepID=UPI0035A86A0D